jgi:hypothetical protein
MICGLRHLPSVCFVRLIDRACKARNPIAFAKAVAMQDDV